MMNVRFKLSTLQSKGPAEHITHFFLHFVCGNKVSNGNQCKLMLLCKIATLVHESKTEAVDFYPV